MPRSTQSKARQIVRRRVMGADGKLATVLVDAGPDHFAAMAGVKAFTESLKAM
jgi:hypothetical protein